MPWVWIIRMISFANKTLQSCANTPPYEEGPFAAFSRLTLKGSSISMGLQEIQPIQERPARQPRQLRHVTF